MRNLNEMELVAVSGGAEASKVEGCGPSREYDVIDCPQSSLGNMANDIANGVGQLAENAIAVFKSFF
ncbi:hypothetical protein H1235_10830 [Pseudoxanthomonas sp. NC8]|nr:hypothetical protein H1235_10830 [Pseudoxanthomonas sp. NC8]